MRLFGRRERIAARPALGRGGARFVTGEWPAAYEAQLREGFAANAIAQRAVRLVAEGCGAAPVYAEAGPDEASANHGGERAVALLGPGLVEAAAMHLLLHGNAYLQPGLDADGMPVALYALRPERVAVEPDAQGWPAVYRYRAGEAVARIAADDGTGRPGLIHVRSPNPADDHYGLGCLGAAMGAVAIHNAAAKWNKALLDNAARPSGALVYEPGEAGAALTAEQFDRLKAEMEASFAGHANAGRPMLLEGGLKWQAMSLTPADMDFVGCKSAAAREIALAFGVPPMLLGLPGDSTHANYAEANRALWRLTILPLMTKLLSALSAGLAAWWPGLKLAVDLDGVPALVGDRERLWRQVTAADFLSADEKREMLGFGALEPAQRSWLPLWPRATGTQAAQGGGTGGGGGPPPVLLAATLAAGAVLTLGQLTITHPSGEQAETATLVARMTTAPVVARRQRIDQLIAALKTAGVWAKLDALYLLAAADEQAARLNWAGSQSLVKVNAPSFTADRGFGFDGATSYLSAGEPFGGAGRRYARNSAFMAVWDQNGGDGGQATLIGADTVSGDLAFLNSGQTGAAAAPINAVAGGTTRTDGARAGFHGVSRTGTASVILVDGSLVTAGADPSSGVPTADVTVGKISSFYNVDRRAALAWGGGLTATEMGALRDALQGWMTAVGA